MSNLGSSLEISQRDLKQHLDAALGYFTTVSWTPNKNQSAHTGTTTFAQKISIEEIMSHAHGKATFLLPDAVNTTLNFLREGLMLAHHLTGIQIQQTSLGTLLGQNQKSGALSTEGREEMTARLMSTAGFSVHALAFYVLFHLRNYKSADVTDAAVAFEGVPEYCFNSTPEALQCTMYYYAVAIQNLGASFTPGQFVKLTLEFFEAVLNEVHARQATFTHTEHFEGFTYEIEGTSCLINGFEARFSSIVSGGAFKRREFKNIVGNRHIKRKMKWEIDWLTLGYDPTEQAHIFSALPFGHINMRVLLVGIAGSGKGEVMCAAATYAYDLAERLGLDIPTIFHQARTDSVSTLQGGTSKYVVEYFEPFTKAGHLILGFWDEFEYIAGSRKGSNVSEGTQGGVTAILAQTDGPQAVRYGNTRLFAATNYADLIDAAVLSRFVKETIDGPVSEHDFTDQFYLWIQDASQQDNYRKFADVKPLAEYEFLHDQKPLQSLTQSSERFDEPEHPTVLRVFKQAVDETQGKGWLAFVGRYCYLFKQEFPGYSGRDGFLVQGSINRRINDIDPPEEWLVDNAAFVGKPFADKVALVEKLRMDNLKGASMQKFAAQELNAYFDSYARIAEASDQREKMEMYERLVASHEANQLFNERYVPKQ